MKRLVYILLFCALAACAAGANPSATAVENYFKALAAKDGQKAVSLACAQWEEQASLDADTFALNPATAENIACKAGEKDGNFTVVTCTGKLVLDYNGEKQEINLADRSYLTIEEGGEWRMCGYK